MMSELTPDDVRAFFFAEKLAPGAPQRRAIAVEVYGSGASASYDVLSVNTTTGLVVTDVLAARALLESLPTRTAAEMAVVELLEAAVGAVGRGRVRAARDDGAHAREVKDWCVVRHIPKNSSAAP